MATRRRVTSLTRSLIPLPTCAAARRIRAVLLGGIAALVAAAPASSVPDLTATLVTGRAPCGAAAGFGSLWVVNDAAGTLVRVDPLRNRVDGRVRIGRAACYVAAGAGAVWVVRYGADVVDRVDPYTLRHRTIRVDFEPFDVAVAFHSVWVSGFADGVVDRIDPRLNRVVERFPVGGHPTGLAVFGRQLVVGMGRGMPGFVLLDPATGATKQVSVGQRGPAAPIATRDSIWLATSEDTVVRYDPGRGIVASIPVSGTPANGAVDADGTIWMPTKATGSVTRIDPATNRAIETFPVGPGPLTVLHAFGSMWVTSYAGNDVRRFRCAAKTARHARS